MRWWVEPGIVRAWINVIHMRCGGHLRDSREPEVSEVYAAVKVYMPVKIHFVETCIRGIIIENKIWRICPARNIIQNVRIVTFKIPRIIQARKCNNAHGWQIRICRINLPLSWKKTDVTGLRQDFAGDCIHKVSPGTVRQLSGNGHFPSEVKLATIWKDHEITTRLTGNHRGVSNIIFSVCNSNISG